MAEPNYLDLVPTEFFKTLIPSEYSLQSLFEVDYSKWDWSQLLPSNNFKFVEGVTPFSNKNFIFLSIFVYLLTVLTIKFLFSVLNIKGWKLGFVSGIHNLILCIWSLFMWVGISYDLFILFTTTEHGINALFCSPKSNPITGRIFYWHYIYFVSKFYEFIDTLIIVLKRRQLIFLHIWHHAIVVLIVWTWLPSGVAYASVGMFANTLVHIFMYYYYFRTSINPSVRIWWKSYLTSGQLFQFTMSFILAIPFLLQDISFNSSTGGFDHSCKGWGPFAFTMVNNLIFLLLFINFYLKTYFKPKSSKKTD
ncbi:hypothetical protein DICPUDRAFT_52726 [Dictyostelium purpureum]|uniref:Elongation of fatty acids protein n=1 Tax=Dictyostelium purpureum TaxID=5786 RepID=F0Z9R5_DICPU|nr:uncharacterized protein DICPUDRAFT_52726 [Dictyostelium purpureum]EGC39291.1 hypothetical protein DICPUDRAFT_52726 [Dictyostelium purpureum]|eukprot:XP_003284195.1 hypothetical protein DICPUDRAFT_52726 [Dictyostelium purpureum]